VSIVSEDEPLLLGGPLGLLARKGEVGELPCFPPRGGMNKTVRGGRKEGGGCWGAARLRGASGWKVEGREWLTRGS
jgi:hypothetical protein